MLVLKKGIAPHLNTFELGQHRRTRTNVWTYAGVNTFRAGRMDELAMHPTVKPVLLVADAMRDCSKRQGLVLDPFMGSGTTAVAALRTNRHFVGFDTDSSYVHRANERIATETEWPHGQEGTTTTPLRVQVPAALSADDDGDLLAQAVREGRQAKEVAGILLAGCGFVDIRSDFKPRGLGVKLNFVAFDQTGGEWAFDVSGAFTSGLSGLKRTDMLWKVLGKAAVLQQSRGDLPLVLLATDTPTRGSAGCVALETVKGAGRPVFDLIELLNSDDQQRLRGYAQWGRPEP